MEKLKNLIKKYPELFKNESFHFGCDDGWFDILDCLLGIILHKLSRYQEVVDIKQKVISRGEEPLPWIAEYFEKNKADPLPSFKILQLKEKFGGLRFYYDCNAFDDRREIAGAVSMAEQMSYRICEKCGLPGNSADDAVDSHSLRVTPERKRRKMSQNLSLDDRMKDFYEHRFRTYLPRKIPVIIRVDGKAFSTATRKFERPFDSRIIDAMKSAALFLCEEIQGCKLAYFQSDEISLLLTDYDDIATEAWFNYNLQKLTSVSASLATLGFNRSIVETTCVDASDPDYGRVNFNNIFNIDFLFDSRAFSLPQDEVINYFIYRQIDALRNSVNSLAQKHFSHKRLINKNINQVKEMLLVEKEINWDELPTWQRRGFCVTRVEHKWQVDENIPIFTQNREYVDQFVFLKEKTDETPH